MNRDVLDNRFERGILGLVLAILIFGPLALGAVETPYFLVIQALTLGVLLLWGVRLWLNPRPQLFWPPICWAVLAFTAYVVVRYLTADLEYVARLEMVRVLIYACLFLAILNNLHRQEYTQFIALTLIFLAMSIACYAIYQFISGSDKVYNLVKPDTYSHRGSGTYYSPNHLAGFLEMILPLGLAWTLVSRARPVLKVFAGYASLVILAGIAVTVSRGGWVATALALICFFCVLVFRRAHQLSALALFAVILGGAIFFIPRTHFFQTRLKEVTANDRFNDSARFELWMPAVHLWQENLWWGVGPNHYNYRFRAYRPETEQRQPDRVHNDYLNTLTDWGIAGAALVSAAWLTLFVGAFQTWRVVRRTSDLGSRSSNKFALLLGASAGLLAILFHSAVDFNLHIPANAILAITLMALVSSTLRFSTDRYWSSLSAASRVLATLFILAALGYLAVQGARRGREYVRLAEAKRAAQYSPAQAEALEKAFAVEPANFETAFAIGRALRAQSWDSGDGELALRAMGWFEKSFRLNPYDSASFMEYGICLDWPLERVAEARLYFDRAVLLDPNGYFVAANMGWHFFQAGDYAAAKEWCNRSKLLMWENNPIADSYLQLATAKLLEAATGLAGGLTPLLPPAK